MHCLNKVWCMILYLNSITTIMRFQKIYGEGYFAWRHNSALQFITNSLQSVFGPTIYVDISGFLSPCLITGDTFRPVIFHNLYSLTLFTISNVNYLYNLFKLMFISSGSDLFQFMRLHFCIQ